MVVPEKDKTKLMQKLDRVMVKAFINVYGNGESQDEPPAMDE